MKNSHKISAVVAAMALLAPAGAVAKKPQDKPSKPSKPEKAVKAPKVKTVSVNLRGTVTADSDGSTVSVLVAKASGQAKGCVGKTLVFSVAKVHVADNNGDGSATLADVLKDHVVKVQGKAPKAPKGGKGSCTISEGTALPAKRLQDLTTPKVDEDETEDEDEATEETSTVETPAPAPTA